MSILDVANKVSEVYRTNYKEEIVEIETGQADNRKKEPMPLNYSVDKLIKTGFQLKGDMETEIINTMKLCEEFL